MGGFGWHNLQKDCSTPRSSENNNEPNFTWPQIDIILKNLYFNLGIKPWRIEAGLDFKLNYFGCSSKIKLKIQVTFWLREGGQAGGWMGGVWDLMTAVCFSCFYSSYFVGVRDFKLYDCIQFWTVCFSWSISCNMQLFGHCLSNKYRLLFFFF